MSRLMEEVLLLGRVEAGKMTCRPAALDLAVFGQRLVDEVTSATNGRCPIRFTAAPGMGEALADEGLLRHISRICSTNAVKYSREGSAVEFRVEARGHLAVFTVSDSGIGIPEGDARLLFQAFHRGRNVGDTPGTGLGMTIVKRCVELHGGKIAFESKEGRGTTFVVALPLFANSSATEKAQLNLSGPPWGANSLSSNENHSRHRRPTRHAPKDCDILKWKGTNVLEAPNGAEGIRLAHDELAGPDPLRHHDAGTRRLSGVAGCALEPRHSNYSVLFFTAKGEKHDLRAGMNLGADDYLVKPVSRADLLEAIEARFERQRLNEEKLNRSLANVSFQPDFSSFAPLVEKLGLTEREAETLLWVAQGKSNADIATILGNSEKTVKKILGHIFEKLGLESRTAAALRAVEVLAIPAINARGL
jgi:DNA-binding NarL/FixJ family response regulator